MPAIKYKVNLTDEEKFELEALIHQGKSAARSQTRARILLKAAAGLQDKDIIQALEVPPSMVAKTRQLCAGRTRTLDLEAIVRPGGGVGLCHLVQL